MLTPDKTIQGVLSKTVLPFCLIAIAAVAAGAVTVLGVDTGWRLALALTVAYALPMVIYNRRSWSTATGHYVLLATWLLMAAISIENVMVWTAPDGATAEWPFFESDSRGYYAWALHYYDGRCDAPPVAFPGLPFMMLVLWELFGVNVVWPVAMNVCFTLMAIVIAAWTTVRLLHGRQQARPDRWLGNAALVCGMLLFFLLSESTCILKEAAVALSMSAVGLVLAVFVTDRHLQAKHYAAFVAACLLLAFTRTTYMYFVLLALGIIALGNIKTHVPHTVLLVVLALIAFIAGDSVAYYSFERHVSIISGGERMQRLFMVGQSQQPYLDMVGNYFTYPIWRRLLLLPLSCSVQFIIPFPWIYEGWTTLHEATARCGFGWYAVGGTALFYYAAMSWRRRYWLGTWAWVPAIIFATIAYVTAGSVSRYVLPVEVMFIPVTVWVLSVISGDGGLRRLFIGWAIVFIIALAVTLAVCYDIQVRYLNDLSEYYKERAAHYRDSINSIHDSLP